mgnify:FL=1
MKVKYIILASILFFSSCKDKDVELKNSSDNLNKYQEYITEVTQGIISSRSDVRVVLINPVVAWNSNEVLDNQLFKVSPNYCFCS